MAANRIVDVKAAMEYAHRVFSDIILLYAVKKVLDNAPAVDAVEVVRCKDCRFYEMGVEYYPDGTKDICRLLKRQMLEDGFCSCGERKDNEV